MRAHFAAKLHFAAVTPSLLRTKATEPKGMADRPRPKVLHNLHSPALNVALGKAEYCRGRTRPDFVLISL